MEALLLIQRPTHLMKVASTREENFPKPTRWSDLLPLQALLGVDWGQDLARFYPAERRRMTRHRSAARKRAAWDQTRNPEVRHCLKSRCSVDLGNHVYKCSDQIHWDTTSIFVRPSTQIWRSLRGTPYQPVTVPPDRILVWNLHRGYLRIA